MKNLGPMLSARAKKQWQNEEYKKFMTHKFLEFYNNNAEYREKNNELLNKIQKEYWGNLNNRTTQAERVKESFKNHPDRKKWLSELAKNQWSSAELLNWRAQQTTSRTWIKFHFHLQPRKKRFAKT